MKKILITGGNGMLAYDFIELFSDRYNIFALGSKKLDITNIKNIEKKIEEIKPNIVLNFAAYTKVDDAEDIGMKQNYNINSLGVYNLAKITNKYNIDFITISTDYVFGSPHSVSPKGREVATNLGYKEHDIPNPINQYGMAKYLGEKLALEENNSSIIIRTSWLYGGGKDYKNFVNTMLELGKKLDSLKVINDQFGNPTNCKDLSGAIGKVVDNIKKYRGNILHLSNQTDGNGISWNDFAREIFKHKNINIKVNSCTTSDFPTKAKRPDFSKLLNNSDIILRNWKDGLNDYLNNL